MPAQVTSDAERFWVKVDRRSDADCWEWAAGKYKCGYGVFSWGSPRRAEAAHRVAFKLCGFVIPAGKLLCHHCDNKSCVNPAHMFLGTHSSNAVDMYSKGRGGCQLKPWTSLRGEAHGRARLNDAAVVFIRTQKPRYTCRQLAKMFGVSLPVVKHVIARRTWRHVP